MLEETGFDYKVTKVDLGKKEQFHPEFKKISPFSKIPVIIDHNNKKESVFESGAILMYLGEKSNKFYDKENRLKNLKPFLIKKEIKSALNQFTKINEKILSNNKFPIVFGGEHSLTVGSIKPFVKKYNEINNNKNSYLTITAEHTNSCRERAREHKMQITHTLFCILFAISGIFLR